MLVSLQMFINYNFSLNNKLFGIKTVFKMLRLCASVLFVILTYFVIPLDAYSNDEFRNIDIDIRDIKWNTDMWYQVQGVSYIPANSSFTITLHNWYGRHVICRGLYYQQEFIFTLVRSGTNTRMNVNEVNDDMSTTWQCNLINNDNTNLAIYFNVNIDHVKPPQMILVNRLVLPTRKILESPEKNVPESHIAFYNYEIGDVVNITCINPIPDNCAIHLKYTDELISDTVTTEQSTSRVGFYTELKTYHNKSRMYCVYTCHGKPSIEVAVILRLRESPEGAITLKIANQILRGTHATNSRGENITYFKYAYIPQERNLLLEYKINTTEPIYNNAEYKPLCQTCNTGITKSKNLKRYYINSAHMDILKANYAIKFGNNKENLEIGFTTINTTLNVKTNLHIDLPKNNILIKLFTYDRNKIWIYYAYDIGEPLMLKCYFKLSRNKKTIVDFAGSVPNKEPFIAKLFRLNETSHNTSIQCKEVNKAKPEEILSQIYVVFLMKNRNKNRSQVYLNTTTTTMTTPLSSTSTSTSATSVKRTIVTPFRPTKTSTSTTTVKPSTTTSKAETSTISNNENLDSTTTSGSNTWILVVAAIVMVVALACVSTLIYKIKRNEHRVQVEPVVIYVQIPKPNNDDDAGGNYAVPDVHKCTISSNYSNNDIYAKAIPKSLRQSQNFGNVYAKTNIPVSNTAIDYGISQERQNVAESENTYANQSQNKDIYSVVLRKSIRLKENTPKDTNTDVIDFEPTYSEPC